MFIVCCICRNENAYIEEFCEHYFDLGFEKIVLCDNHKLESEECLSNVDYINKKIEEGKVDLIIDSSECYQIPFYDKVLSEYDFEWCLVVDTDEFLVLEHFDNIQDFVSQDCYKDTNAILINWMIYGCDGNIKYENKPVKERFKTPLYHPRDRHFKSLIKKGKNKFTKNPHVIQHKDKIFRDANGDLITDFRNNSGAISVKDPIYKNAWINHYYTKSLEEFIIKTNRQKADSSSKRNIEDFFNYEERKPEYVNYLRENGFDFLFYKEISAREMNKIHTLMQNPNELIKLTPTRVEKLKRVLDHCEFDLNCENINANLLHRWMTSQTIGYGAGKENFLNILAHPNDFDERYLEKASERPLTYRLIKGNPKGIKPTQNEIKSIEDRRAERKNNSEWWNYNVHMYYTDTTGKAKIDFVKFFNVALRDYDDFEHTDNVDYIIEYLAKNELLRNFDKTPMSIDKIRQHYNEVISKNSKNKIGFTDFFYDRSDVEDYEYQLTDNLLAWCIVRGTCERNSLFKILPWENYDYYLPNIETIESLVK